MSELQGNADHLLVIGRGRMVADTSVADLLATASKDRIMVRTTARSEATTVLAQGGTVAVSDHDLLAVSGLEAGRIARLLGDGGVPFTGLAPYQASLEEAYMELTRDSVEFHGRPACWHNRTGASAMTTMQTTPSYQSAQPAGRDGFGQVLRAEWTKLRTVRGWVIALFLAAVLTAVLPIALAGTATSNDPQ